MILRTFSGWSYKGLVGGGSATFSSCERYRYRLTRVWDLTPVSPRPPLVFVGLNPSTADERSEDATIRRILGFARALDCGSLIMLNLFGLRSTDPKGLREVDDPNGPDSDRVLAESFESARGCGARLILGWGAHGTLHGRGKRIALLAHQLHGLPETFGLTSNGQPRHPLYLKADARPITLALAEATLATDRARPATGAHSEPNLNLEG